MRLLGYSDILTQYRRAFLGHSYDLSSYFMTLSKEIPLFYASALHLVTGEKVEKLRGDIHSVIANVKFLKEAFIIAGNEVKLLEIFIKGFYPLDYANNQYNPELSKKKRKILLELQNISNYDDHIVYQEYEIIKGYLYDEEYDVFSAILLFYGLTENLWNLLSKTKDFVLVSETEQEFKDIKGLPLYKIVDMIKNYLFIT